jgi:probable HAF family extracellular repeat protein
LCQIVGYYEDSSGQDYSFLYNGGTYTMIDPPGSTSTIADGINDLGQIVGSYYDSSGEHGFIYSGGAYTIIDAPGGTSTTVDGINDLGQIIGYYEDLAAFATVGFVADPTPTVSVSINSADVNLANNTAAVTFAFSEAPAAFTLADTTAIGGMLSGLTQVDATDYTALFTAAAETDVGNASVSVASGAGRTATAFPAPPAARPISPSIRSRRPSRSRSTAFA